MGVRGEAPPRQGSAAGAGAGPLGFGALGPAAAHPAGAWSSDSRREARRWPNLRGAASQQRRDCLYSVTCKKVLDLDFSKTIMIPARCCGTLDIEEKLF